MKKLYIFLVALMMSNILMSQSDTITMEEVLIVSDQGLKKSDISGKIITLENPHDGGAIFKNHAGFGIIKKGNYGMEPVLRGFKFSQLNVQFDGGVHSANACPNRMDPTISQISPEEIEKIEIIKGPYDVRFQSFGGIVNIISQRPVYNANKSIKTKVDLGWQSNGNNKFGNFNTQIVNKKYDFGISAGYKDFGNYQSGNGTEIPSSFSRWTYTLKGGLNISNNQRISLSFRQSRADDILYAGLPMDADFDKSSIVSTDYVYSSPSKTIRSLKVKMYASMVDHEMSTRNRMSWNMIEAIAPVQAQVYGGRAEIKIASGKRNHIFTGIDVKQTAKQGVRNRLVKINSCTGDTLPIPMDDVDKIWQDSRKNEVGFFVENNLQISDKLTWQAGLRLNTVTYSINDPAEDFKEFYNGEINPDNMILPYISSRLNFYINKNLSLQWAIGMAERSPDIHELFINHLSIGMDAYEYLGNPNLKPETNYQSDIRLDYTTDKFSIYADVFYSYLNNYISAKLDTSIHKKFMPCNPPYGTKVFTNVEKSYMTGFEAGGQINLMKSLTLSLSAAYTYAQNISWDEPLAEIPPFTVNSFIAWEQNKISTRLHARFAMEQNRVSTSFGESTTPGFSVFDWYINYKPFKFMSLNASITNIFDINYAEHLSRAYKNMAGDNGSLYFEPGRSFNVGIKFEF